MYISYRYDNDSRRNIYINVRNYQDAFKRSFASSCSSPFESIHQSRMYMETISTEFREYIEFIREIRDTDNLVFSCMQSMKENSYSNL